MSRAGAIVKAYRAPADQARAAQQSRLGARMGGIRGGIAVARRQAAGLFVAPEGEREMKHLSQDRTPHRQAPRQRRRLAAVGAAGLILALVACTQRGGLEDVKPTATTAYRTPQPDAPQPASQR